MLMKFCVNFSIAMKCIVLSTEVDISTLGNMQLIFFLVQMAGPIVATSGQLPPPFATLESKCTPWELGILT